MDKLVLTKIFNNTLVPTCIVNQVSIIKLSMTVKCLWTKKVAVGIAVTHYPPHRSLRALLVHKAPPLDQTPNRSYGNGCQHLGFGNQRSFITANFSHVIRPLWLLRLTVFIHIRPIVYLKFDIASAFPGTP